MKSAESAQIREFLGGDEPLVSASIRVTKGCNLGCKHCYAEGGKCLKNELNTEELKKTITSISDLGSLSVFFTGGEPWIRSDFVDILKFASDSGLSIYASTNGTLVTEENLRKIKNLDIKLFQISLDSTKAEVHDGIRGKGVFDKATKAVRASSKILGRNVAVGSVLMNYNHDEMGKLIEFSSELGADIFAFILLLKYGRADKRIDATISQKISAMKDLFDAYDRVKDKISLAANTTIPPVFIPKEYRDRLWDKICFCSFPYTLGVEANGDVAPCDGLLGLKKFVLGNVRKDKLKDLWGKSRIFGEIKAIKVKELKGACGKCKFADYCRGGCRAAAYLEYDDIRAPDPLCQEAYEKGLFPEECLHP